MPTLTAMPVAIPQDTDQEFELDIRTSTVNFPSMNNQPTTGGGTYTCSCECSVTCTVTFSCNCGGSNGTCQTCYRPHC